MSVILKDSNNITKYTFPSDVELISEPWGQRLDSEPKAYAHGDVIIADEKVTSKLVSLYGIFNKASAALMETELKSMRKACYTKNYRLYATQNSDEYYDVKCLNFEHEYLGMLTMVELNIDFLVSGGFRYYKDATPDTHDFTSSPDADVIANGGNAEVHPVITITGGASTSTTNIRILNFDDGNKYFDYAGAITTGDVVVIDCQAGTVKKNSVDDIANFTGSFLKLVSGNNAISTVVTGTVGTITLLWTFRKRFL